MVLEKKSSKDLYTISSHQLLRSSLSVSPFLVCWDAWLCRSPPPWWVQRSFPAEHGSLWSRPLPFSPLLHPVLGVKKTPFGMVNTEVISPTMVKPIQMTSLAVSLLATRVLSVALLYSGHCSLFTTLEHWYLQYQYFLWNRSAATVPCVLQPAAGSCPDISRFKWVFLMSHGTVLCHFRLPCYWWFVLNATTTSSTV
jgi:hypothetical protein